MGDAPHHSGSAIQYASSPPPLGHTNGRGQSGDHQAQGGSDSQVPFSPQLQYQYVSQQQQHRPSQQSQHAFASQYDMAQQQQPQHARGPLGPYNMGHMMQALPQPNYHTGQPQQQHHQQQRYSNGHHGAGQPMPQTGYMAGNGVAMNSMPGPQYYMSQQHGLLPQYYAQGMPGHQQQHPESMSPRAFYQQPHPPPQQYYYPHGPQFTTHGAAVQNHMVSGQYNQSGMQQVDPRLGQQADQGTGANFYQPPAQPESVKSDTRSSVVRGPPRKPKQSGHAIWIGNLPPQTELMSLVYHVCKEAPGLESLFLISKSNCAFANFRDEQACVSAQQKIHDSKFQTVRLVSRLRKSTVEGASGVTAPTGPAASTPQPAVSQDAGAGAEAAIDGAEAEDIASPRVASLEVTSPTAVSVSDVGAPPKDKYFILKSLTVEDLEQSIKTGIWATQSHNEKALNNAFQTTENVYLVFSANKSGEYFGYARMTSQINEDPAAAIEFAPKAQSAGDVGRLPKAIPTEANEFMPRGSIMDDSERGTIFWEAEHEEGEEEKEEETASVKSAGAGETKTWGKPFQLEWISTVRLPFYRTRGIRNPWNSNREVKIARDGTELEPSVGRRLTGLFASRDPGMPGKGGGMRPQQAMGMAMGVGMVPAGYPPMQPLYQQ